MSSKTKPGGSLKSNEDKLVLRALVDYYMSAPTSFRSVHSSISLEELQKLELKENVKIKKRQPK